MAEEVAEAKLWSGMSLWDRPGDQEWAVAEVIARAGPTWLVRLQPVPPDEAAPAAESDVVTG